jgi:hypothetical protein
MGLIHWSLQPVQCPRCFSLDTSIAIIEATVVTKVDIVDMNLLEWLQWRSILDINGQLLNLGRYHRRRYLQV